MMEKIKINRKEKMGFTLIELVMVIVVLGILSTLAVTKLGSVRDSSARKTSIVNVQALGRSVQAYLSMNNDSGLNRLDSLIDAGTPSGNGHYGFDFESESSDQNVGGLYRGPVELGGLDRAKVEEQNVGLSKGLRDVLCLYRVNKNEVEALKKIGLDYVMRHNTFAIGFPAQHYGKGDDGTVPQAANGLDPALSACVATALTNGMVFAAVTPITDFGRVIYQGAGQELLATASWGQGYDEEQTKAEVKATGGPLLALGLGESCSMIGKANGGLEAAPYSEVLSKEFYRQYILLIRLRTIGEASSSVTIAEFAGVLDPEGNSIRKARFTLSK